MTIPTIFGYDATAANEHVLSLNELCAGYDTQLGGGTGQIAWTPEQFLRHQLPYPAMHIDQDPNASDPLADWLDVEAGAASANEIVNWLGRARACFARKQRPDQRWPGIYLSESNLASAVALLAQANVTDVPFGVANYSYTESQAVAAVANAIGPYPRVWHQFTDLEFGGLADGGIFSLPYVQTMAVQSTEPEMQISQFMTQAYVPFKPGAFSSIILYRDFVSEANPVKVRLAVHSASKGYTVIDEVNLNASVPVTFEFTEPDVNAVSMNSKLGGPVGYCLT